MNLKSAHAAARRWSARLRVPIANEPPIAREINIEDVGAVTFSDA